jgi:hypothetical protein
LRRPQRFQARQPITGPHGAKVWARPAPTLMTSRPRPARRASQTASDGISASGHPLLNAQGWEHLQPASSVPFRRRSVHTEDLPVVEAGRAVADRIPFSSARYAWSRRA